MSKTYLPLEVEEQIKKMLFSGELHPNDHINIDTLAKACKCSKTPIREALKKIAAENLLVYEPKIGYRINSFTIQEYLKRFELQELIEVYLIREICKINKYVDFDKLYKINDNIKKLILLNNVLLASEENEVFHATLYENYRNDYIVTKIKQLWTEVRIQRNIMYTSAQFRDSIASEHEAILKALSDGDSNAAEEAMRQHYKSGKDAVIFSQGWQ